MATAATAIPDWAHETLSHLPACVRLDVAAHELGVSIPTLRRWEAQGLLRVLRSFPGRGGGCVLVARVELARLLASLADPARSGA